MCQKGNDSKKKPQKKQQLKTRKALHHNDTPTTILKVFEDLFATFIYNNYHKSQLDGTFPEDSKTAEAVNVYNATKCTDKNNYRLVSIMSNISKFMNQMYDYFD